MFTKYMLYIDPRVGSYKSNQVYLGHESRLVHLASRWITFLYRRNSQVYRLEVQIYTIIKTTGVGDGRLSVVDVAGWAWSTHATVPASQEQTLSGRGARVYTCTCVRDNIPCIRLPK